MGDGPEEIWKRRLETKSGNESWKRVAAMEIGTRLSTEMERYLDLSTRQVEITEANMANIDTPGYRAIGMDFEAEMRRAVANVDSPAGALVEPGLFEVDGLVVRPDGNDVSMDREGLKLADAQLKFKIGVALLKRENARLTSAIHADGK